LRLKCLLLRLVARFDLVSMLTLVTDFALHEGIDFGCPWIATSGEHIQTLAVLLDYHTEASTAAGFPEWSEEHRVRRVTFVPVNRARRLPVVGPLLRVFDRSVWVYGRPAIVPW
jgi:hypothetical protein